MAKWTKADYEMVAEILKNMGDKVAALPDGDKRYAAEQTRQATAQAFAQKFKADNPNFKLVLFYKAAGVYFTGGEKEDQE